MYNCPNCSGNLSFDIASQKLMCDYCKTQLDPYEYQKTQDAGESDMFGVTVFTCPQCGGEIMTTNVTAAGFCTYCGASTILDSRMSSARELRDPEFLDRFRGIYIPYWVYNYSFNGNMDLTGTKSFRRGDYMITEHYRLSGEVDAGYKGLTHDASSSFDDNVAAAIAPFEAAKMQPFTPSILCGFYADAPDVNSAVYEEDILDVISEDSISRLSGVPVYRNAGASMPSAEDFKEKLRGSSLHINEEKPVCAYLPVWFLTYRNKDRVAYAVMNGSTGKLTADLPVDTRKYLLGSLLLAVPLFAVLAFLFTLTGQMVLTASSVLALISMVLYGTEIAAISNKDSRAGDKGFRSGSDTDTPARTSSGTKKKTSPGSLVKKAASMLWTLVIIILFLFNFLSGSFPVTDIGFTGYKIYGGISLAALLGLLIYAFTAAKTEMSRKNLFLHSLGAILLWGSSANTIFWRPGLSPHSMTGKEETTVRNKNLSQVLSCLILSMVIVSLSTLTVRADGSFFVYTNPQTGYSIYIDDGEDLLTDSEEAALIEDMKPVTEFGNAGFVTCENNDQSTSSYSSQKYAALFGTESGSLLVIDMGMREFYIKNNGEISKVITNAYSNTISDNIYRYAARGEYYKCASSCFEQIYTLLSGGRIAQPMRYISAALLALILGLLINYMLVRALSAPKKAGAAEVIDAAKVDFILRHPTANLDHTTRVYSPVRSSGGSGGGSRGGGGGGGHSGGSGGGHRF